MTRYDRSLWILAICLTCLTGYVDALGFLELDGFFVSFMSGNSTKLGVGLSRGGGDAGIAAGLIASFVLGIIGGSIAGAFSKKHRRLVVLLLVAALLGAAALLHGVGWTDYTLFIVALAMGIENAVFEQDREVPAGVTYVTGTLVKLGQRIAAALRGGDRLAWVPFLLLWLGLMTGALAGAAVYPALGLNGLWIAAAAAFILAIFANRVGASASE